ncbi:pyruvate kinase [Nitrosomonas sp. wSCUT-2]
MIKHQSRAQDQDDMGLQPFAGLLTELEALKDELKDIEQHYAPQLRQISPLHQKDAINLIHYLGLRRRDMRDLQARLAKVGLSSLGRMESHVLSHLNAIINLLDCLLGKQSIANICAPVETTEDITKLESNTNQLFGKPPAHRRVRIMVTLPAETANDYSLIKEMLVNGMDCARINCAHDSPEVWLRMIEKIHQAHRETGKPCRILMDLGGPKLRTGSIANGPPVLKWKPQRDIYGKVTFPARIWLYPEIDGDSMQAAEADASVPVQGDWLANVKKRDVIELTDARGSVRTLRVIDKIGRGCWTESYQTVYLKPGTTLSLLRLSASGHARRAGYTGMVGALPSMPETIRLHTGDSLVITREQSPGRPAQFDVNGHLLQSASIACTLPEVFQTLQPGERILIDDGRIGGIIRSVCMQKLVVEITQARESGEKLLADKGINLPDSQLALSGLTAHDIEHLEFVAQHADMVGLSFVRQPSDISQLQEHLQRLKAGKKPGIVLKVETRAAFENLPGLLLTLLRSDNAGLMIARGDLAVECGYERLAEMQEEILWLAEGAHLPVIWATQVLEGLSKTGKPSRAEISDAAMGERSECVMLNKGAHIIKAIQSLDDILHRMQSHQQKKSSLLRRLHW